MILFMYSLYDTQSGVYDRPFCQMQDNEAKRTFCDWVANKESVVGRHPEDFHLVRVGVFDDVNGKIGGKEKETIITGLEAVSKIDNVTDIGVGGTG